jgi:hypothetical protein
MLNVFEELGPLNVSIRNDLISYIHFSVQNAKRGIATPCGAMLLRFLRVPLFSSWLRSVEKSPEVTRSSHRLP